MNNWLAILAIGIALIAFSIYYSMRLFNIVDNNEVNVIYIEEILVPLIPFMFGGYCLYSSTRTGTILSIKTVENKTHKFSLRELEKANYLQPYQEFLKEKLNRKIKIKVLRTLKL